MTPTHLVRSNDGQQPRDLLWHLGIGIIVVAVLQISASTASAQFVIAQAAGTD